MTHESSPETWRPTTRILFRFSVIYLLLFAVTKLASHFETPWVAVVEWIAVHVLDVSAFHHSGGDSLYGQVQLATVFVISVAGTFAWSVKSRRLEYEDGMRWLVIALRHYLC